jgi:hypothetical protein
MPQLCVQYIIGGIDTADAHQKYDQADKKCMHIHDLPAEEADFRKLLFPVEVLGKYQVNKRQYH